MGAFPSQKSCKINKMIMNPPNNFLGEDNNERFRGLKQGSCFGYGWHLNSFGGHVVQVLVFQANEPLQLMFLKLLGIPDTFVLSSHPLLFSLYQ